MLKKLVGLVSIFGLSVSAMGFTQHPFLETFHNAIRNRDARHLSYILFGEDLSYFPQLEAFPTRWYQRDANDFLVLLAQRNSEGESAWTLCEDFPDVRVVRVLNYAKSIVMARATFAPSIAALTIPPA